MFFFNVRFGADYFSFWWGGMRGLVLNTSLWADPDANPVRAWGGDGKETTPILCCVVRFTYESLNQFTIVVVCTIYMCI